MSILSVMPSKHLIVYCPLLLLPSIFPSIRVFSSESALHIRWPKYWSFRFSINPSSEYSGLIFFRIDCFDLLAVQGSLNCWESLAPQFLLKHHNSFFMVQLSHLCMTTGETIALTVRPLLEKCCLCFLMHCHSFSSKEQSSFNFMAAVTVCNDFGAQENKICHFLIVSPFICHEVMGLMPWS